MLDFGKMDMVSLEEVDSTNTYGKIHFDQLKDGTLISARKQTAGRGRLDRKWLAPAGACLTVSLVMKQMGDKPFYATCCVSMAILDLLREVAPNFRFYVKWPNDIYCGDAKIAGILCEGILGGGKICGIVAGMGININLHKEDLAGIDQAATSLSLLTGHDFDLHFLLKSLAKFLSKWYIIYLNSPELLFESWKQENRLLGHVATYVLPSQQEFEGTMTEILSDGAILVESNGKKCEFRTGDIRVRKGSFPTD